jgi:SAM-dependent methyltransferase
MSKKQFCFNAPDLSDSLVAWFRTPAGQFLLEQEWDCLEGLLGHLFGYHLIQVGQLGQQERHLTASKIRSQVLLDTARLRPASDLSLSYIRCRLDLLPVVSDTIDVVILPHTLDFSAEPHQVLREVDRVLIAEGRVLITAFNPWSLWGLWRLFHMRSGKVPWCGQFVSPSRVLDWLSLLGFEVEKKRPLMFRPPFNHRGLMRRLSRLDSWGRRFWPLFSGVYVIQAVKRVTPLTPRRAAWKLRTRGISNQVAEPSARSSNRG